MRQWVRLGPGPSGLLQAIEAMPEKEERIVEKWRLQPGRMLLIDLEEGRIIVAGETLTLPQLEDLVRDEIARQLI